MIKNPDCSLVKSTEMSWAKISFFRENFPDVSPSYFTIFFTFLLWILYCIFVSSRKETSQNMPPTISHTLIVRVCGDPDHSRARKLGKVVVLKLLGNGPRNKIPTGALTPLHVVSNRCRADLALQTHLDHAQNLRQAIHPLAGGHRAQQTENVMGWRVRQHLQVVGRVLEAGIIWMWIYFLLSPWSFLSIYFFTFNFYF